MEVGPVETDIMQLVKLIPTCVIITFALAIAHHEARPYEADSQSEKSQDESATSDNLRPNYEDASKRPTAADCLLQLDDDQKNCKEDANLEGGAKWSPKVISCLTNCANCVRQWRAGVYDGRSCARDCIQGQPDQLDSLDPDCSLVKYFNSTVLASVV